MKHSWIMLLGAVLAEVLGTCAMKWSQVHASLIGYVVMYLMLAISYGLLSIAIKKIPLALSYAVWEGVGLFFITLISIIIFDETLSITKSLALILIGTGIILLKTGNKIIIKQRQDRKTGVLEKDHVPALT